MSEPQDNAKLNAQKLWAKYEDIAMHFNDLLMRLRSQSLAGIAAISTLVGIFTKSQVADIRIDWMIALCMFTGASLFWVAIWCIDFLYYNRLLLGAVAALRQLENEIQSGRVPTEINMSTYIEAEFSRSLVIKNFLRFRGILLFYAIVLFALTFGAGISLYSFLQNR